MSCGGDDLSSADALQEAVGYLLGGDTSQQKMFLLVGPKRAGKGTIGRVLTGLLGAHNVAAPTLASLSTNFGLSPLIGKPLALISDARLSGRTDSSAVVERLLSISGEDSLTVDRKYKEPWTGRLPTRLVLMTNELPRLADASGALASRFIVLVLTQSFYGRENTQLTETLLSEAPGIFNWALDGLDRLNERGHFVNPESGSDAIQQLEDLSSPVTAFLRDACIMGSHSIEVGRLWGGLEGMVRERGPRPRQQSRLRTRPARRSTGDQENTSPPRRQTNPRLRRDQPKDGAKRQPHAADAVTAMTTMTEPTPETTPVTTVTAPTQHTRVKPTARNRSQGVLHPPALPDLLCRRDRQERRHTGGATDELARSRSRALGSTAAAQAVKGARSVPAARRRLAACLFLHWQFASRRKTPQTRLRVTFQRVSGWLAPRGGSTGPTRPSNANSVCPVSRMWQGFGLG